MKKLLLTFIAVLCAAVSYAQDVIEVTCEQAREIALALTSNNTPTEETYAVTGYITNTDGKISREQQIFWMADTKDGGKVFEGYWANIPDPTTALKVGTKVKMTGKIMKYNTTPEIKNGTVEILEESTVKIDTIKATAAEAFAVGSKLNTGESTTDFYDITAYVDSITYAYSNGTMSFTMTDTKGVKGDGLVAYKTSLAEAALVGAKVRVLGTLTNYNGTIEIASGSGTILEQGTAADGGDTPEPQDTTTVEYKVVGNGTVESPYTADDVKYLYSTSTNSTDKVWVSGTIVGTASSGTSLNAADADSNTNLAIGTEDAWIPVQLPAGDVRSALNLQDNPDNKGKAVIVYGKIEKYFTVAGVKSVSDFVLDGKTMEETAITNVKTAAEGQIYNLQGQRVSQPQKGLYIQNGRVYVK